MITKQQLDDYLRVNGKSQIDSNSASQFWDLNPKTKITPMINVDAEFPSWEKYHTTTTARDSIPLDRRIFGLILTYRVSDTNIISEQYIGNDLTNRMKWLLNSNWTTITSTESKSSSDASGCNCDLDSKLDKASVITKADIDYITSK